MILVTGGTGLLGSWVLLDLLRNGEQVRALKRNNSSLYVVNKTFKDHAEKPNDLLAKIEWVEGDIMDIVSLESAMKGVDKVYHCAAIVSFQGGDKERLMNVNVQGTTNVVNQCLHSKISKLCYVSSVAAIGRTEGKQFFTEDAEWTPSKNNSVYAQSKYKAEMEVWRGQAEGLDVVIVNPSIILGNGQKGQGSSQLFEEVNKGLKFYTSGLNGFVDVRDVASIMIRLMNAEIKNERFILNGGNVHYKDVFTWMAKSLGVKAPHIEAKKWMREIYWRLAVLRAFLGGKQSTVTKETARTAANKHYYDNSKILKTLKGFKFHTIEEAVRFHAQYFEK